MVVDFFSPPPLHQATTVNFSERVANGSLYYLKHLRKCACASPSSLSGGVKSNDLTTEDKTFNVDASVLGALVLLNVLLNGMLNLLMGTPRFFLIFLILVIPPVHASSLSSSSSPEMSAFISVVALATIGGYAVGGVTSAAPASNYNENEMDSSEDEMDPDKVMYEVAREYYMKNKCVPDDKEMQKLVENIQEKTKLKHYIEQLRAVFSRYKIIMF